MVVALPDLTTAAAAGLPIPFVAASFASGTAAYKGDLRPGDGGCTGKKE